MSEAAVFRQKAEMFEERAQSAADPISRQHYREMAAHCQRHLPQSSHDCTHDCRRQEKHR